MWIVLAGLRGTRPFIFPNHSAAEEETLRKNLNFDLHDLFGDIIILTFLFRGIATDTLWQKSSTHVSHISDAWHRSQLVLVELRRRREPQKRPTETRASAFVTIENLLRKVKQWNSLKHCQRQKRPRGYFYQSNCWPNFSFWNRITTLSWKLGAAFFKTWPKSRSMISRQNLASKTSPNFSARGCQ